MLARQKSLYDSKAISERRRSQYHEKRASNGSGDLCLDIAQNGMGMDASPRTRTFLYVHKAAGVELMF